jgi:hypothetical protein
MQTAKPKADTLACNLERLYLQPLFLLLLLQAVLFSKDLLKIIGAKTVVIIIIPKIAS